MQPGFKFGWRTTVKVITHIALAGLLALASTLHTAYADEQVPQDPGWLASLTSLREAASERANLVMGALTLTGVNYRRGGNTPETGLDCSGLVRHVFRETLGMVLPRRSADMSQVGNSINVSDLKPGDLVFFNTLRSAFSHVGIYVGEGKFLHAPSSGGAVRVDNLSAAYWAHRFNGARRVLTDAVMQTSQPAASAPAASDKR